MAAEPERVPAAEQSGAHGPGEDPMPSGPNPVELDRLIHGRVRLGIVSALAVHEVLTFPELKELLDTSDGNLSVHARRLEDGGYLSCEKSFQGRMPRTEYRLTVAGRKALDRYLDHMEALIDQVRDP
jgi:DNA-binding HxlR family transcriptional regulator